MLFSNLFLYKVSSYDAMRSPEKRARDLFCALCGKKDRYILKTPLLVFEWQNGIATLSLSPPEFLIGGASGYSKSRAGSFF